MAQLQNFACETKRAGLLDTGHIHFEFLTVLQSTILASTHSPAPVSMPSYATSETPHKEGRRQKRKLTNRARNRLLSIQEDALNLSNTLRLLSQDHFTSSKLPPIFGNERCGTWYIDTRATPIHDTCCFKSTDGHTNTWNFSLKRLNLNVVRTVSSASACIIVDASASKDMPDSLSRTVPVWCCVLNRLVDRFRRDQRDDEQRTGQNDTTLPAADQWDSALYTPSTCVPGKEHVAMEALMDDRVWTAYTSQAIVDPDWLMRTLRKPLRPMWILSNQVAKGQATVMPLDDKYFWVICVSCSDRPTNCCISDLPLDPEENQPPVAAPPAPSLPFLYSRGAADDQESWARGLTPALFWNNVSFILTEAEKSSPDQATDEAIDQLVLAEAQQQGTNMATTTASSKFDWIGQLGLAIGTRGTGRPPKCWESFDAVLNVTELMYDGMQQDLRTKSLGKTCFHIQLPVREGKRDKIELERWMAVGIAFVALHASYGRRILIHCAQGKDRSVAMAMACVMALCERLTLPLLWRQSLLMSLRKRLDPVEQRKDGVDGEPYGTSGLSSTMVESLLGQAGRNRLLSWIRKDLGTEVTIQANKDTLRLALLLIQQDREKADPTRSTMQKLNRFFMSEIMFTP